MTDLQLEICKKIYPDYMIYCESSGVEPICTISLSRLLYSLWDVSICTTSYISSWKIHLRLKKIWENSIDVDWILIKKDWMDWYLLDQSEETQKKVAELLWVTF